MTMPTIPVNTETVAAIRATILAVLGPRPELARLDYAKILPEAQRNPVFFAKVLTNRRNQGMPVHTVDFLVGN